jgi:hypothetical protein
MYVITGITGHVDNKAAGILLANDALNSYIYGG